MKRRIEGEGPRQSERREEEAEKKRGRGTERGKEGETG